MIAKPESDRSNGLSLSSAGAAGKEPWAFLGWGAGALNSPRAAEENQAAPRGPAPPA